MTLTPFQRRPHKRAKKSIRDAHTAAQGYDNPPTSIDSGSGPTTVPIAASTSSSSAPPALAPSTGPIGVLAPQPKAKKAAVPKDKLNSFGGRKDLGGLSKSVHRILNAVSVREEYHANKKRKREEDDKATLQSRNNKKPLVPLPYESLSAFNRRVEIALRPSIDTAIRGAKASKKAAALSAKKAKKTSLSDPSVVADSTLASGSAGAGKGKATAISPNDSVDPLVPKPKIRTGPTEFAEVSQRKNITDVAMAPPTLKKARRGLEENRKTNEPMVSSRLPISEAQKLEMAREREKAIRVYRELKEKREKEQKAAQS